MGHLCVIIPCVVGFGFSFYIISRCFVRYGYRPLVLEQRGEHLHRERVVDAVEAVLLFIEIGGEDSLYACRLEVVVDLHFLKRQHLQVDGAAGEADRFVHALFGVVLADAVEVVAADVESSGRVLLAAILYGEGFEGYLSCSFIYISGNLASACEFLSAERDSKCLIIGILGFVQRQHVGTGILGEGCPILVFVEVFALIVVCSFQSGDFGHDFAIFQFGLSFEFSPFQIIEVALQADGTLLVRAQFQLYRGDAIVVVVLVCQALRNLRHIQHHPRHAPLHQQVVDVGVLALVGEGGGAGVEVALLGEFSLI